jgi:BASS family bile acid:Na+ symporter
MNIRSAFSFLSAHTPAVVAASAVAAYFRPDLFSWVRGSIQTAVLGAIMLAMGMTLAPKDFRVLAERPFDVALGTVAQFAVMPLLAFALAHALRLSDDLAVGLVLVGCSPGGVSSNVMSFLCRGDVAFSVGMTSVSTLLSPVLTPLLVLLLAGERVDIDAVGMFKSVLVVTIGPVGAGFLLNRLFGKRRFYGALAGVMPGVAVLGLACIVGGVSAAHGGKIVSCGATVFAAVVLHNALGYALGYAAGALARFSPAKRRTVSIEVGMQNAGLATVLAARHFPAAPEAAIVAAVSCLWHSVSGALLAGLFNVLSRRRGRQGMV